jgi:hypothetical protein
VDQDGAHGDGVVVGEAEARQAAGQLQQREAELFAGELGAGAAVDAVTEGEVAHERG